MVEWKLDILRFLASILRPYILTSKIWGKLILFEKLEFTRTSVIIWTRKNGVSENRVLRSKKTSLFAHDIRYPTMSWFQAPSASQAGLSASGRRPLRSATSARCRASSSSTSRTFTRQRSSSTRRRSLVTRFDWCSGLGIAPCPAWPLSTRWCPMVQVGSKEVNLFYLIAASLT